MILDTNFIIDLLNGKKEAVFMMRELIQREKEVAISSPTLFELWSGLIVLKKSDEEKNKVREFLKGQILYAFDERSAEVAGVVHGDLIQKGLEINPVDAMIAGIALQNHQMILTRDKHFTRVEGLKIVSY